MSLTRWAVSWSWILISQISKTYVVKHLPSNIHLNSNKFSIGDLASLGLNVYSDHADELVKGLIKQIDLRGKLNGIVNLNINSSNPTQSKGKVKLSIDKMLLAINDPNLDIAPQRFKKAKVIANLKNGSLSVDKSSGFHSQELTVDLSGILKFSKPIPSICTEFQYCSKAYGVSCKKNFGFLLSMAVAVIQMLIIKIVRYYRKP